MSEEYLNCKSVWKIRKYFPWTVAFLLQLLDILTSWVEVALGNFCLNSENVWASNVVRDRNIYIWRVQPATFSSLCNWEYEKELNWQCYHKWLHFIIFSVEKYFRAIVQLIFQIKKGHFCFNFQLKYDKCSWWWWEIFWSGKCWTTVSTYLLLSGPHNAA